MVVVKVMAGLGNQMFQYALYRYFLSSGKDAKLDISYYDKFNAHNGYELARIFDITENYATIEEAQRLGGIKLDLFSRAIRKFIYIKKTHYIQNMTKGFGFDDGVLSMDNVYLQGYWQSEKYFYNVQNDIRRDFSFKKSLDPKNVECVNKIINSESIGIHIRRGDYVTATNLGTICSLKYYKNAISFMQNKVSEPSFFIFSDDIEWCKDNISHVNSTYIDWNMGLDSYKDMQLMSLCKHNIIANSSFSWWGAWLNDNSSKIVIAPDKWFGNSKTNTQDIIPDSWIKISTK